MVANARKIRMIYNSDCKNDRLDARMLARLGRIDTNLLAPNRHRGAETQADLAAVRGREALVAARVKLRCLGTTSTGQSAASVGLELATRGGGSSTQAGGVTASALGDSGSVRAATPDRWSGCVSDGGKFF